MALFTDAAIITLDDLLLFETSLVGVASSHGINVETKISLAISAIGDKLMFWLLRACASDPQHLKRRMLGLSTVVVTPTLHRWLCFDALSRFFAEAYNAQLNTRFEGKLTEYKKAAADAETMVSLSGVGVVYAALPKPKMPVISLGSGTGPAEALFFQTTWTDAKGNEGALSPVNALMAPNASSITITMAESAADTPAAAAGWNIYASSTGDGPTRQNDSPLSIGSVWPMLDSGLVSGPTASDGQQPNYYVIDPKRLPRG
jgi:hypothetical protein